MAGKLKLTSAGVVLTDGKGGGTRQELCPITREWKPVKASSAPKAKPKATVKPSAPAKAAKPLTVLEMYRAEFGHVAGSVLYASAGGPKATLEHFRADLKADLDAKAAAKAKADRLNALLKSDNPAVSFGASQVAKMQGKAKAPAASAPAATVRARKPDASDRKEGRDVGADFAKAIAQRMQAAK